MYTDLTAFHCYTKKCMTHKNKITPATSPLLCNHAPYLPKHNTAANINAIFDLLMLMVHQQP